jgi:hypothetical protein
VENATPATLQRVKDIIRADRRVTIDAVASNIGCSHGQTDDIMHGQLGFHKVFLLGAKPAHTTTQKLENELVIASSPVLPG